VASGEAYTFASVSGRPRHAGLETCVPKLGWPTAGWEACATTLECRRVSRKIVARLQRLMATMAANPGRCPGLSCGGLSGLVFAPPFWKKEAMDFPLTERLSRNDSVKKNFNHRWTQINTDEETSERRSGPDFRRSLNDALYVLEYHVFHLCPSVVKKSFTAWIRLRCCSTAGWEACVGMLACQRKNCCALTALDGNGGGKPRALPRAVMWRPFRPCIRTAILEKGGHGFSVDGTAQP